MYWKRLDNWKNRQDEKAENLKALTTQNNVEIRLFFNVSIDCERSINHVLLKNF